MSLGLGIFLFVIGAILAFAVDFQVSGIDLPLIGYILMGAGAIVIVVGIALLIRGRSSVAETRTAVDPASGQSVTRTSRNETDPLI
jgi:hypothetical protein